MDGKEIAIVFVGLSLFLPVAAVSVRIALKPVVEAIARLMEIRAGQQAGDLLERRVALLEQEIQVVRAENSRLMEEREFYNQLDSPNRH